MNESVRFFSEVLKLYTKKSICGKKSPHISIYSPSQSPIIGEKSAPPGPY